jgi:hypothetical protein
VADLVKYPRTRHIEGSRLGPGDADLDQVPFADVAGRHLVVEEKCDGANSAISCDADGSLLLQSRGHFLTGGPREKHFNLLKQWATCHQNALRDALGARYVMCGEWLYAKHTIYYDALPPTSWSSTSTTGNVACSSTRRRGRFCWRACRSSRSPS